MENEDKYNHVNAAISFCDLVRTTLGPRGMNKMLVDSNNKTIALTNDGATIIKTLKGGNPIIDLFKSLASSQEEASGDGTTTAVIFAGQLLQNAMYLLNKGIHPTTVISGFNLARANAVKFLTEKSESLPIDQIIKTAFGTKISPDLIQYLTDLILKVKDYANLKVYKIPNMDALTSEIYSGFVFSGFTINDRMESQVTGKMAVLDFPVNLKFDKFSVTSAEELEKASKFDTNYKKKIVDKLVDLGVKCVFYTDTTPEFETYLTEKGITGIVVFQRENVDGICKSIGANAASSEDQIEVGNGDMTYVKTTNPNNRHGTIYIKGNMETLVLKGPTNQTLDEILRALDDVLGLLRHDYKAVIGAGAIEIELGNFLREFSKVIGGKEQLAIEKFAEAVENLPLIIAENCGLDAIETLTTLKTLHSQGKIDFGVDAILGVSDARVRGVVEPVLVKTHAIISATNVANSILKTDKILIGQ